MLGGACAILSVFIKNPQFQGQTKEKLASPQAAKLVETSIKDHFDHWLSGHPDRARILLDRILERADERLRRRQEKELNRKSATRKLRLPGKLSDCSRNRPAGTEVFLVEGDSAGGSAKQARNRETQAVLPLRGKILNVVSATQDKMKANQEISDIIQALGCGSGTSFDLEKLRYERIIIMTDADVDGAHIRTLLLTFFYKEMKELIDAGYVYIAQPPLFRLSRGKEEYYAYDEKERETITKRLSNGEQGHGSIALTRYKGLGEMNPDQLWKTTMDPATRTILKVELEDAAQASFLFETLMGDEVEPRRKFIEENAKFVRNLDV
jgi:topoisomerase-4 subunit B